LVILGKCPRFSEFEITVDNGNNAGYEPFFEDQIHAFNGLCLAVVQSIDKTGGDIDIIAASPGLKPASITIVAKK
jgi:beta-galactosidase